MSSPKEYPQDAESSTIQARWSFSPGDLAKVNDGDDDDFWGTTSTSPTASVDSDGDLSIVNEAEFAEDQRDEKVPPPPSPSSPSERDLMIQDCYKNFREMSFSPTSEGKPRLSTITSPVKSYSSPRPSLRKKEYQRKTRSLRDRSAIRDSLRNIMDFED